jgi:hypothetical protein
MLESGDILSHHEMCLMEGRSLQQGMSFRTNQTHSILLMSQRSGAPYPDRLSEDSTTLYYIGHDSYGASDKGRIDQPLVTATGSLTQSGRFFLAAEQARQGNPPELVRVYEKLSSGIWVFNGLFELRDAKMEFDGVRKVCVFELHLIEGSFDPNANVHQPSKSPGRLIPTWVKLAVLKRDKGSCQHPGCHAKTDLHFDHILPFSRGGSSSNPDNIQLLCQRHNLEKSANII